MVDLRLIDAELTRQLHERVTAAGGRTEGRFWERVLLTGSRVRHSVGSPSTNCKCRLISVGFDDILPYLKAYLSDGQQLVCLQFCKCNCIVCTLFNSQTSILYTSLGKSFAASNDLLLNVLKKMSFLGDGRASFVLGVYLNDPHLKGLGLIQGHWNAVRYLQEIADTITDTRDAVMIKCIVFKANLLGALDCESTHIVATCRNHAEGYGVPANPYIAMIWKTSACNLGLISEFDLASDFSNVDGIRDSRMMVVLLRRGALSGDTRAMNELASMYFDGFVLPRTRDCIAAFYWYLVSAFQSNHEAYIRLAELYAYPEFAYCSQTKSTILKETSLLQFNSHMLTKQGQLEFPEIKLVLDNYSDRVPIQRVN